MQLTLHLRTLEFQGELTARVVIFYSEDIADVTEDDQIVAIPEKKIVDEMEVQFEMRD
jgi:hypothetical protein